MAIMPKQTRRTAMATTNGFRPATRQDMTTGAHLLMVIGNGGGRRQRMPIVLESGPVDRNGHEIVYFRSGRLQSITPINEHNLLVRT